MRRIVTAEYLAGLFDGEGCVDIVNRTRGYLLRVKITNTHRPALSKIQRAFGGSILPVAGPSRPAGYRALFDLTYRGAAAAGVLAIMAPHLIIKARQASIAAKFFKFNSGTKRALRCEKAPVQVGRFVHMRWRRTAEANIKAEGFKRALAVEKARVV